MKVFAISLFVVVMVGLLFVWGIAPHGSAAQTGDYDRDDDGLIEIQNLEQLNAVRWDLDGDGEVDSEANRDAYAAAFQGVASGMGCADSGCVGYELARDLDFDDAGSYASGVVNAKWTEGAGWLPIGVGGSSFQATFDGNERTVANLYIKRSGLTDPGVVGLFGMNYGSISRIGLIDVNISGDENVGGLTGDNSGRISASYVTGDVSGSSYVGGLVGLNFFGVISASYATGDVSGGIEVGGLVGRNYERGKINESYATGHVSGSREVGGLVGLNFNTISASYATGDVSGGIEVGGLVGYNYDNGQINVSYATGNVSGSRETGGLVGDNSGTINTGYAIGHVSGESSAGGLIGGNSDDTIIIDSYWDTQTTGQSSGVGEGSSDGVVGKTTAELQAPVGYTGIYAGWLLDFDNADGDFDDTTGVDDYWDFGTASEYPALKADLDGDGVATWEEFGDQRGQSPAPASTPIPIPTPSPQADLELTMLVANYFGIPFYYMVVENNGPSDATEVVVTDSLPEGVSSMFSIAVAGTCSGERTVVCELGDLEVGSKNLVMIIARVDASLSQDVPVNAASVSAAESDPYPANNRAHR